MKGNGAEKLFGIWHAKTGLITEIIVNFVYFSYS